MSFTGYCRVAAYFNRATGHCGVLIMHLQIWNQALTRLRSSLDGDVFSRWIAVISPVSLNDSVLTVAVDNEMLKMWVENNYLPYIIDAIRIDSKEKISGVRIEVDSDCVFNYNDYDSENVTDSSDGEDRGAAATTHNRIKSALSPRLGMALNANYTFTDFIIGPSNSFAHAASMAVASNPGGTYNPLFIYGDTGLGKTHMMQAVGHSVQSQNPNARVCYITSEALLNDFIESIGTNTGNEFRKRYRSSDVLLIDDIQFLADKTGIQEEFFHTFNTLQNAHKQIIITSDRPPNKIQGLEARLVSRFQQGLTTHIEKPDFETRMAILRHKQRNSSIKLDDSLLTFIAQNVCSNVRQLEGAIISAVSYASLSNEPLTVELLREVLKDILELEKRPELSFHDIQRVVADDWSLRMADMTSRERTQSVALPRQIAMFLCRVLTHGSLSEIATAFDKTHATVVHACKTIYGRIDTDEELRNRVDTIVKKLGRSPSELAVSSSD
jgi:chromosomal replication initiator protein